MTGNAGAEFLVHVPLVLTTTEGAPAPAARLAVLAPGASITC